MANELKKITALPSGTPADTDVVPFVDLATNTTKKALKSELKGDKGDAATVDAGTTTTLAAGESATVTNVGTTSAAIFNFAIPQGIQGLTGADGACVESVAFVGNDMVFTLDDASTVTLTNAKTDLKGDTGLTGAKITSAEFVGDDLVFTLDDASTVTITGAKTALKGDTGAAGADGDDGAAATIAVGTVTTVANNVPASVTNVGTSAAAIFDFEIPKGLDGTGSGDVIAPATNTDSYIPQWNGANSKTLKNGLAVPDGGLAGLTALGGKQDALGFTPENVANKENTTIDTSTTKYPTNRLVKEYADGKVEDSITDGHTTIAPSGNAVFDALAGKASLTGTETLTNKRITPRVISATSYTTDTGTSLNADNCDIFRVTAQEGALLFNAPGGTPVDGQKLIISVASSTTTARALTWNAIFEASTVALPTTTAATTAQLNIGFIYSTPRTKWVCVAVS